MEEKVSVAVPRALARFKMLSQHQCTPLATVEQYQSILGEDTVVYIESLSSLCLLSDCVLIAAHSDPHSLSHSS